MPSSPQQVFAAVNLHSSHQHVHACHWHCPDFDVHTIHGEKWCVSSSEKLIAGGHDAGTASCSRMPTCCRMSSHGRGHRRRRHPCGCGSRAGSRAARRRGTGRRSCTSLRVCLHPGDHHLQRTHRARLKTGPKALAMASAAFPVVDAACGPAWSLMRCWQPDHWRE